MWVSRKEWKKLEKRVADLEKQVQGRTDELKINPHDTFPQRCRKLAMKYQIPLEYVINNYDTLSEQDPQCQ